MMKFCFSLKEENASFDIPKKSSVSWKASEAWYEMNMAKKNVLLLEKYIVRWKKNGKKEKEETQLSLPTQSKVFKVDETFPFRVNSSLCGEINV